jgi:hypothetical protein
MIIIIIVKRIGMKLLCVFGSTVPSLALKIICQNSWLVEIQIEFLSNTSIERHSITIMLGATTQSQQSKSWRH